jgi:hypothetical protein
MLPIELYTVLAIAFATSAACVYSRAAPVIHLPAIVLAA